MTHIIWVIQSESYKSDYVRECYDTVLHHWCIFDHQLFFVTLVIFFCKLLLLNAKRIYLFGGYCSTAQETTNGGAGNLKERPIDIFSLNTSKCTWYRGPHNRCISCFYCCIRIDVICLFDSQTTPRSFLHIFKCNLLFSCIVA